MVICGTEELENNALYFHLWDRDSDSLKRILLQMRKLNVSLKSNQCHFVSLKSNRAILL